MRKTQAQKYREGMRQWALLWRRTGSADDLRFAISCRRSAQAWSGGGGAAATALPAASE